MIAGRWCRYMMRSLFIVWQRAGRSDRKKMVAMSFYTRLGERGSRILKRRLPLFLFDCAADENEQKRQIYGGSL